ncbi:tyrosine-type recombinase/integrase [Roseateles albus]|uniref:Integrase family protein n=1 Tax=Roseateles albus TaxID=2987525 RepID=A0ABT5K9X8_9BURK|nr:integrase family protein [Roseateles albus]MDC8770648.1 integrase family protein [Roseateles albus]
MAKVKFTAPKVAAFKCSADKAQAFMWDSTAPGLGLRVTPAGKPSYVFQGRYEEKTIRVTIGSPDAWSIPEAQAKTRELQRQIDEGRDPREVKAAITAADVAKREADRGQGVTVAEVWPRYLAEGKPKRRTAWKPGYRADLEAVASMGGVPKKRGQGLTKPGRLSALMALPLASIDQDLIRDWYAKEAKTGPYQASRAMAMFSGFLGWCATKKDYRALVDKTAARASELGDVLPEVNRRTDCIEIDQLPAWFSGTDKLRSRAAAAYLQCLVLTGARREEMAGLRWADVDFQWSKLTIADKVDNTRTIPLSPYVASLLAGLPRTGTLKNGKANPFVFASALSASGRITEPRAPLEDVLKDAGIPHMTIHGLRRTFSLLGEAAGAPAGAIAQVMGHKPSATAEGYRPRSIDALRPYLALIEAFILEKAGITFDPAAAGAGAGGLKLVASA